MTKHELRKLLTTAIDDPGRYAGYKEDRSMGEWIADALLIAVPSFKHLITPPAWTGTLSPIESKVLSGLAGAYGAEEYAYSFKGVERLAGATRGVRTACRSLSAKGLMQFRQGLLSEDGGTAGSGYGVTKAGLHYYWTILNPTPAVEAS
jgi:hypothetical protein